MAYKAQDLTTVIHRKRRLVMYSVQKSELDMLAEGYTSIHLALCGISFGAAMTILVTLVAVALHETSRRLFSDALVIFLLGTLYCGAMAFLDRRRAGGLLKTINSEMVDVVVAEDKEKK
jgi:hypothetical protein